MNIELVKQYIYLFLGWSLPVQTYRTPSKKEKIDAITFEIDLANEIYLELIQRYDLDDQPFAFAKQQMVSHQPKASPLDYRNSCYKPYHMLAEVEETVTEFYPILGKIATTKQTVDKLIVEILEQFEETGFLESLKKSWH